MNLHARFTVTQDIEVEVNLKVITNNINKFFQEHMMFPKVLTEDDVINFWENKDNDNFSDETVSYTQNGYVHIVNLATFVCEWIEEILYASENGCINDEWIDIEETRFVNYD